MSAVSGPHRALQSPGWDPISPGSSRRSSEAGGSQGPGARMSPVMSHHLTKLHRKALAAGTTSSLAQVTRPITPLDSPNLGQSLLTL
jgi:hypothetical protein